MRADHLRPLEKYARTVRANDPQAGPIELPRLRDLESQMAIPAVAMGQLVGVLVVESNLPVAFGDHDQAILSMIAGLVANAIEGRRSDGEPAPAPASARRTVRYFPADGTVFLDDEYLIRGVAGRLLWVLLTHHERSGRIEFTHKELRLDPSLELPDFRDNLDTRVILLKRRLEERQAPIRIDRSGRGRFTLHVDAPLRLES